jgi:hypothetical protein
MGGDDEGQAAHKFSESACYGREKTVRMGVHDHEALAKEPQGHRRREDPQTVRDVKELNRMEPVDREGEARQRFLESQEWDVGLKIGREDLR